MCNGYVRDRNNKTSHHQDFDDGITVWRRLIINGTITGSAGYFSAKIYTGGSVSDFDTATGMFYGADTSAAVLTATMESNPNVGDMIRIWDVTKSFDTYPLTIDPNGKKIEGSTGTIEIGMAGALVTLVYVSAAYGWAVHVA